MPRRDPDQIQHFFWGKATYTRDYSADWTAPLAVSVQAKADGFIHRDAALALGIETVRRAFGFA